MKRVILDLRGLVLHGMYSKSGGYTMSRSDSNGETIPTAGHGVNKFLDVYLQRILEDVAPVNIIAVMEGKDSMARRCAVVPDYKKKNPSDERSPEFEDEVQKALSVCSRALLHLGAMVVDTPYLEGDDTVAFLVKTLKGELDVYTVDNDLLACHRPGVTFYVTDYNIGAPVEKTQYKGIDLEDMPPRLITLYKSLVGDTGDNIKGVTGVGEKAFHSLAASFGIDGLDQLAEIVDTKDWALLERAVAGSPESKPLAKVLAAKEQWRQSWFLAKLHPEWCEISFQGKTIRPNWQKRLPIFEKLEAELQRAEVGYRAEEFRAYCIQTWGFDLPTVQSLESSGVMTDIMTALHESPLVAYDYESYDTNKFECYREMKSDFVDSLSQKITGASFCFGPNSQYCFYVPVEHRDTQNVPMEYLESILKFCFDSPTRMVVHNNKFELTVGKLNFGWLPNRDVDDTRLAASYVDEEAPKGLKYLSQRFLNYKQASYSDVVPDGMDMSQMSMAETLDYGCDDSLVTAHLRILLATIAETEGTLEFLDTYESAYDYVHVDPFIKGIPINFPRLKELELEDAAAYEKAETRLRELLSAFAPWGETTNEGMNVLYSEALQIAKGKNDSAKSPKSVDVLEKNTWEKVLGLCRYSDHRPPVVTAGRQFMSDAARSIGLPAYRAHDLAPAKLEKWAQSLLDQAQEAGVDLTEQQQQFVTFCLAGGGQELVDLMQEIHNADKDLWVGSELNVGSPDQMAGMLYGMLQLPIVIRNDAKDGSSRDVFGMEGAPSTNDLAIQTWMTMYPEGSWKREVLDRLSDMRKAKQRYSLYYRPYPLWARPGTNRIHPQITNCGTKTRRPSGNSPNLLQVSKTKDDGRIRSCFEAQGPDEVVVSIDWSQQELAILAAVSQDPNLLMCYVGNDRKDVHSMTSVRIAKTMAPREGISLKAGFGYEDLENLRKQEDELAGWLNKVRGKKGKPTNFLMVYGGSETGLSRKLIVPIELAREFFKGFFQTYPRVLERQEYITNFARRHGYVTTAFGNRKHCEKILSRDGSVASAVARGAINMEMQGTAADIAKMTMFNFRKNRVTEETGCTLMAVVYDEVVASVPKSNVKKYIDMMVEIMSIQIPNSDVVLTVEASIGTCWAPQVELKGDHSQENIDRVIGELA